MGNQGKESRRERGALRLIIKGSGCKDQGKRNGRLLFLSPYPCHCTPDPGVGVELSGTRYLAAMYITLPLDARRGLRFGLGSPIRVMLRLHEPGVQEPKLYSYSEPCQSSKFRARPFQVPPREARRISMTSQHIGAVLIPQRLWKPHTYEVLRAHQLRSK